MRKKLGNLKSQIKRGAEVDKTLDDINYELKALRAYRSKLRALIVSKKEFKIATGSGIDYLESLTKSLPKKRSERKKLHNEIAITLDILLNKGDITKDDVIDYYEIYLTPKRR